ncbi:MAG: YceI family protein [Acidimicrobiales bacterium]
MSPGLVEHELGPPSATLRLRTYRQGLAAKAGHDLVLEATVWHGNVVVPDEPAGVPSVRIEVDLRSLHVVEGSGGVKPLTDGDKEDIRKTMQKPLRIADYPTATFRSTEVSVDGDHATLQGELTLAGQTHPVELHVRREGGGTVVGHAEIIQSAWGIKPYSGFLGALKLRDAVDVDVSTPLPD